MTPPPHTTAPEHLADLMARRFPLVPRRQPKCGPLNTRIARVRELADQATTNPSPEQRLIRAAEAHTSPRSSSAIADYPTPPETCAGGNQTS